MSTLSLDNSPATQQWEVEENAKRYLAYLNSKGVTIEYEECLIAISGKDNTPLHWMVESPTGLDYFATRQDAIEFGLELCKRRA